MRFGGNFMFNFFEETPYSFPQHLHRCTFSPANARGFQLVHIFFPHPLVVRCRNIYVLYVCICICVYTCVYVCLCVYVCMCFTYVCLCVSVCMYTHIHIHTHACTHIYTWVYIIAIQMCVKWHQCPFNCLAKSWS